MVFSMAGAGGLTVFMLYLFPLSLLRPVDWGEEGFRNIVIFTLLIAGLFVFFVGVLAGGGCEHSGECSRSTLIHPGYALDTEGNCYATWGGDFTWIPKEGCPLLRDSE